MIIQDHSLVNEFPAHVERIQELNLTNDQFHQQYNQYHELDRQVRRIEEGLENAADDHLETLKRQRLTLKDTLYSQIQRSA
ncbi:YdcH family protein [Ferrimonas pelagia]|uniref:YdcH family protein n=1 Tax=Ferrimonas pelagia TaxID=1177826 RepID=A0ABP9EVP3_9GAMM